MKLESVMLNHITNAFANDTDCHMLFMSFIDNMFTFTKQIKKQRRIMVICHDNLNWIVMDINKWSGVATMMWIHHNINYVEFYWYFKLMVKLVAIRFFKTRLGWFDWPSHINVKKTLEKKPFFSDIKQNVTINRNALISTHYLEVKQAPIITRQILLVYKKWLFDESQLYIFFTECGQVAKLVYHLLKNRYPCNMEAYMPKTHWVKQLQTFWIYAVLAFEMRYFFKYADHITRITLGFLKCRINKEYKFLS